MADDTPEIQPFGRAAVGSTQWTRDGKRHVTFVSKATYTIGEGGPMELTEPEPLRAPQGGDAGDLVPYRSQADMLVFGDPEKHPAVTGVGVAREGSVLAAQAPVIPHRGDRIEQRSLGIGATDDAAWSSYQEAPPGQQCRYLRPGDEITAGSLHGVLPPWRGALYVGDRGASREEADPLDMEADGVHVDLDRRLCSVLYRSVVQLDDDEDLGDRTFHLGVEPFEEDDAAASEAGDAALPAGMREGGALPSLALGEDDPGALGEGAAWPPGASRDLLRAAAEPGALAGPGFRDSLADGMASPGSAAEAMASPGSAVEGMAGPGSAGRPDAPGLEGAPGAARSLERSVTGSAGSGAIGDGRAPDPSFFKDEAAGGAARGPYAGDRADPYAGELASASEGPGGSSSSGGLGGGSATRAQGSSSPGAAATGFSSQSAATALVKRSAASTRAPTLPGTNLIHRTLYQRFGGR